MNIDLDNEGNAPPPHSFDEAESRHVHARARRGIKLLMGRQVFLQVFTFAGGIVLARVLMPAEFGLYAIATFLVSTIALFGDFGLSPSFIQRKEDLTDHDLQVGFTLQQVVTTLIVVVLWASAPWLTKMYPQAPAETVWLVRALAVNLYLSAWRSMSAIQLERHLNYDRLARIEVVEALSYQGLAVILALRGYGIWSFVWATLARGILGSALVFMAAPWPVRLRYDPAVAKAILRYGIPFQLGSLANQAGSWVTPLLVGSLIGPHAVGFLTWASSIGKKPLLLVDNIMRVAFPHFSRIQQDRGQVEGTLTNYLTYLLFAAGLWFTLLLVAGPLLVRLIYTDKWMPAVPALILFAAGLSLDTLGWIVGVCLNSLGSVAFTTRIVIMRTAGNIALGVLMVLKFGFIGVPIASLAVSALTIPWILHGVGPGAANRMIRKLSWLCIPVATSISLGAVVLGSSLTTGWHAIVVASMVLIGYIAGAVVAAPLKVKEDTKRMLGRFAFGS